MKKYTKYLNYVLRHKWYVMIECFKRGQYWRGIMHDMSKFRPSEFIPYAIYFYEDYNRDWKKLRDGINCYNCKHIIWGNQCDLNGAGIGDGTVAETCKCKEYERDSSQAISIAFWDEEKIEKDFNIAWLKHIHRNPHHWQYWVLREDNGGNKTLQMPGKYIDEMISDWNGAGMAITGKENTREWYIENKDNMNLNENTRHQVETCINVLPDCMK